MIILLGGEKGGSGKSALATNLSVWLKAQGRNIVIADADPQGTATKWAKRRADKHEYALQIPCVPMTGEVFEPVRALAEEYDDVLIDTGGRDSQELRSAMSTANKMIIPLLPAMDNLETTPHIVKVFREAKALNPGLRGYIVLNQVHSNPRVNAWVTAKEALSHQQDLEMIDILLRYYAIYQDANGLGLSVLETKHPQARAQIQLLAQKIFMKKKASAPEEVLESASV